MYISDLTQPDQYTYTCVIRRAGLEGRATVTQESLRPFAGAYEMKTRTGKEQGGRMGKRQEEVAQGLALEAKGNLTRALYAAGWRSEQVQYAGRDNVVKWVPKQ